MLGCCASFFLVFNFFQGGGPGYNYFLFFFQNEGFFKTFKCEVKFIGNNLCVTGTLPIFRLFVTDFQ